MRETEISPSWETSDETFIWREKQHRATLTNRFLFAIYYTDLSRPSNDWYIITILLNVRVFDVHFAGASARIIRSFSNFNGSNSAHF